VLWRRGLQHHWRSLAVDEAWALDAARRDVDFAGICEGLCEWIDASQVALRAAGMIKGWLNDGLIAGVAPAPARAQSGPAQA
jgi:hypothetical protein